MGFKDLFSGHSGDYSKFRPTYPTALFEYLASQAPRKKRAWDVGTGNGQAALELAAFFQEIVATDPSERQLQQAAPHPNILYAVAAAEKSGLSDGAVDLITVAQAFHWFRHEEFFSEVRRVAAPGAVLAIWCYGLTRVSPEVDPLVLDFYGREVGPFWDPERKLVEEGYRSIDVPFEESSPPTFAMRADWSLDHFIGYLGTWSAVQKYEKAKGLSPIPSLREKLEKVWPASQTRAVSWPLSLRVFRVTMT